MKLEFADLDRDWMPDHGRPSRALGYDGMPSYTHEDNGMAIFDLLVVNQSHDGGVRLLSRWYGSACVIAPEDMVPLHHNPGAWFQWRPLIYTKVMFGWQCLGSQSELAWRHGLAQIMAYMHADEPYTFSDASDRGDELLLSVLAPTERLDMALHGKFRVRGGATGHTYMVDPGNGFERIDPVTLEPLVSYCLHPEGWLPIGDVAVATKLALENPVMEYECLEGANASPRHAREPTDEELTAARWEGRAAA